MSTEDAVAKKEADEKARIQREAEQEALRKAGQLRRSALMLAEDQHGSDDEIVKLKKNVDVADAAVQQFQQDLRGLQMDSQFARIQYEKALEKYIDPRYQFSKEEWIKMESRFKRNA